MGDRKIKKKFHDILLIYKISPEKRRCWADFPALNNPAIVQMLQQLGRRTEGEASATVYFSITAFKVSKVKLTEERSGVARTQGRSNSVLSQPYARNTFVRTGLMLFCVFLSSVCTSFQCVQVLRLIKCHLYLASFLVQQMKYLRPLQNKKNKAFKHRFGHL